MSQEKETHTSNSESSFKRFLKSFIPLQNQHIQKIVDDSEKNDYTSLERRMLERLNNRSLMDNLDCSTDDSDYSSDEEGNTSDEIEYLTTHDIASGEFREKVDTYNQSFKEFYIPMSQETPMINPRRQPKEASNVYQKLNDVIEYAKSHSFWSWNDQNKANITSHSDYLAKFISGS